MQWNWNTNATRLKKQGLNVLSQPCILPANICHRFTFTMPFLKPGTQRDQGVTDVRRQVRSCMECTSALCHKATWQHLAEISFPPFLEEQSLKVCVYLYYAHSSRQYHKAHTDLWIQRLMSRELVQIICHAACLFGKTSQPQFMFTKFSKNRFLFSTEHFEPLAHWSLCSCFGFLSSLPQPDSKWQKPCKTCITTPGLRVSGCIVSVRVPRALSFVCAFTLRIWIRISLLTLTLRRHRAHGIQHGFQNLGSSLDGLVLIARRCSGRAMLGNRSIVSWIIRRLGWATFQVPTSFDGRFRFVAGAASTNLSKASLWTQVIWGSDLWALSPWRLCKSCISHPSWTGRANKPKKRNQKKNI